MKNKNPKLLLFILVLSLLTIFESVFALSATLYGEITDDGGDPDLYVWFRYRKEGSSQIYETPRQRKYGAGEFSATISSLESCTTYFYRAVARHVNYNDERYGEEKTFTTPCPRRLNLKVNNSDGPITLSYRQRVITLSWEASDYLYCYADTTNRPAGSNISWFGSKPKTGSETINLDKAGLYIFTLQCEKTNGERDQDSVQVNIELPELRIITKGVVVTY